MRYAGLFLAAILILFLAFGRHPAESTPPGPAAAVAPPPPPIPSVHVKKKARKKILAKLAEPVELVKVRGSRLRDKGEALGGRTPDRVDTGTMTVPASQ